MNSSIIEDTSIVVVEGGSVDSPKGFKAGGFHCGLKRKRKDIGWIVSSKPAAAAGVFTVNSFQAPPLKVTQESLKNGHLQGVIVNSANANAFTGERGRNDALAMRKQFAEVLDVSDTEVAVTSTGVIGEYLPMETIHEAIWQIPNYMPNSTAKDFGEAILTTDTTTKEVAVQCEVDGEVVTIGGVAKGSGMIKPNMATMLGFITTDAIVNQYELQQALHTVTDKTFNRITVDGDTSTNDMVLLMANGEVNHDPLTPSHPDYEAFCNGLEYVCVELAKMIARDGEGATKLVEVEVSGARTENSAAVMAKAVVGSSLVKTAIHGEDANWGRIICALGYSGESIREELLTIKLGPYVVVKDGRPTGCDDAELSAYLSEETIKIEIQLGNGEHCALAWGCDLSYEYVRINASYRT